jgi:arylsulfatase A-like enzyme
MYPSLGMHNGVEYNNFTQRMVYNCMSRILDDGVGNVTAALKARGFWDDALVLFSADNVSTHAAVLALLALAPAPALTLTCGSPCHAVPIYHAGWLGRKHRIQ